MKNIIKTTFLFLVLLGAYISPTTYSSAASGCEIEAGNMKLTLPVLQNTSTVDESKNASLDFTVTPECVGKKLRVTIRGISLLSPGSSVSYTDARSTDVLITKLHNSLSFSTFEMKADNFRVFAEIALIVDLFSTPKIATTEKSPVELDCSGACDKEFAWGKFNGKDPENSACVTVEDEDPLLIKGSEGKKITTEVSLNEECLPTVVYVFAWKDIKNPNTNDFQVIAAIQVEQNPINVVWEIIDTDIERWFYIKYVNAQNVADLPPEFLLAMKDDSELTPPMIKISSVIGGEVLGGKGQSFGPKTETVDTSDPCYDAETNTITEGCYGFLEKIGSVDKVTVEGGLVDYINQIIATAIKLASLIAVVMIVISGVQYMTTEAIGQKSEAKQRIFSSILGLLLALSIYIILNTINPNLLNLKTNLFLDLSGDPFYPGSQGGLLAGGVDSVFKICPVASESSQCGVSKLTQAGFSNADKMSKICQAESGASTDVVSGVDICAINGKDKSAGTVGFSVGLFQINILAHADKLSTECKPLLVVKKGTCLQKANKGGVGYCALWSCNGYFQDKTKVTLLEKCQNELKDASKNIEIAKEISSSGKDLRPWSFTKQVCGL